MSYLLPILMHHNSGHTDMLIAEYFHMNQPGEISITCATGKWRGGFLKPRAGRDTICHSPKICFPQPFTAPCPKTFLPSSKAAHGAMGSSLKFSRNDIFFLPGMGRNGTSIIGTTKMSISFLLPCWEVLTQKTLSHLSWVKVQDFPRPHANPTCCCTPQ